MNQASELDVLDYRMAKFWGGTLRAYVGGLPSSYSATPTGTKLAQFTLPNPSHNSAVWNSGLGVAEATMRGTWADQTADDSGTFGCYTITDGSGAIIDRGTIGVAGSGAGMIVNAAAIAAGAPFTVTDFTIRAAPLP